MGKSNRSKAASNRVLRVYMQRRDIGKWLTIISAVLFVILCMAAGLGAAAGWLVYASLGLYIFCFVLYRIFSQCPYCGKSIMKNFSKLTHCPYCKRPIKEVLAPKSAGPAKKL